MTPQPGNSQEIESDKRFEISEAESAAILETAVEGVITINTNGIVHLFNPAAEAMFGYRADEVIGKNVSMLMPEPYHTQHNAYMRRYLETGEKRIIGIGREVLGKRKNGAVFPLEISVTEVKVDGAQSFTGVVRDVTERKEMEATLRQNAEQLAHYDRVDMMGEIAAGIAHEINQPLTAIATYAQACRRLVKSEQGNKQDIIEALDTISQQAERAGDVIRRLRNIVKRTDTQRDTANINTLVEDAFRLAKLDTRTMGLNMRLELQKNLPHAEIDTIQIQQVVLNLIRNAVDALSAERKSHKFIEVKTRLNKNDEIEVVVTDNGCGIAKDIALHLFHPFFTTKEKGMGIGLSISQSIINAHAGKLWFESDPGKGTSFFFSLPIALSSDDD